MGALGVHSPCPVHVQEPQEPSAPHVRVLVPQLPQDSIPFLRSRPYTRQVPVQAHTLPPFWNTHPGWPSIFPPHISAWSVSRSHYRVGFRLLLRPYIQQAPVRVVLRPPHIPHRSGSPLAPLRQNITGNLYSASHIPLRFHSKCVRPHTTASSAYTHISLCSALPYPCSLNYRHSSCWFPTVLYLLPPLNSSHSSCPKHSVFPAPYAPPTSALPLPSSCAFPLLY